VLLGLLEERHGAEDAGAVHENIHAAEALERDVHHSLRVSRRADPTADERYSLAARVEVVPGRVEHLLAPARKDDRRALVEQAGSRRLADSTAAARDDCHLALELVHLCPFLNVISMETIWVGGA
jgi:hypothetical protein